MAVLEGFPWERLRPLAIVLPFDDRWSASRGHEVRDLAEQLLARGYQVWISHRHPRTNGAAGSDWQRLATYVGNPVAVGAEGRVIAFLEPVPVDVMESVLTDVLTGEGTSAPEAKSKVLRFGTVAGRPDARADASRRATAVLQL
jgi:hypothetical protein